jgi:uncharacterized protein YecT (DUF1311 family)
LHQLDLSTLSGPELRSLLDSARDRGQAAQSYEILQEMARRREGGEAEGRGRLLKGRRRASEPRIITLDLGDPLEPRDDDPFEAPEPPKVEADDADMEPPLTLAREPEPARAARPSKPAKPPKAPRPVRVRRGPGSALGLAVGALGGIVLGVAFGGSVGEALFPPPDVELAQAAQLPPPPPPLPEEPPAPAAAAPPQVETVAAEQLAAAAPSVETAEMVQDAVTVAEAPEPEPAVAAPAETACAGEPTPADRTICEDAELRRLQRELRQAYAEALAAHEARDLLRQRQLAWRDARNSVSDPQRLAGLYEARIRKLKAATADAKAAR